MWHEGTIGIPQGGGEFKIAHYWVKAFEEGSKFGIDGGRISKLSVKIEDKWVLTYDRGWDQKAETRDAEIALAILMKEYN